jgi:glycosyltransferase involved in cell wall biosynthesis
LRLDIYGNIEEYPDYGAKIKLLAQQDPRIEFKGTFANERIAAILSSLDVLVVPSLWYENSPLVVYSAQAAECPVLASNVPGIAEVVQDEVNGLLVPAGDVLGLAAAIQRLAKDRALLRRLRERAVKPKPIQQYVDELLLAYKQVTH